MLQAKWGKNLHPLFLLRGIELVDCKNRNYNILTWKFLFGVFGCPGLNDCDVSQGFSYWGMGVAPLHQKNLIIPPASPGKIHFHVYNPIKTWFLVVVIAPVPFLF